MKLHISVYISLFAMCLLCFNTVNAQQTPNTEPSKVTLSCEPSAIQDNDEFVWCDVFAHVNTASFGNNDIVTEGSEKFLIRRYTVPKDGKNKRACAKACVENPPSY